MTIGNDWTFSIGGFNLSDETHYQWTDVRGRSADDPVIERYSAPGRHVRLTARYQF